MNKKGKIVFCITTNQIFPSAILAAQSCNENYHTVVKKLEGKQRCTNGNRYVYLESMADLHDVFRIELERQRAEVKAKEINAEIKRLERQIKDAKERLSKLS